MKSLRVRVGIVAILIAAIGSASFAGSIARAGNCDCDCSLSPKVIVLRGVFEVFSLGMNDLARKLRCRGYDAKVTSWSLALLEADPCDNRPIVVVGHSLGGRACGWIARKLRHSGKRVPLIIIIDANLLMTVPDNVDYCLNLYTTNPLGIFHGTPVEGESPCMHVVNWDVSRGRPYYGNGGVNHFDIDATDWVHQIIVDEIEQTFPVPTAFASDRSWRRRKSMIAARVRRDLLDPDMPTTAVAYITDAADGNTRPNRTTAASSRISPAARNTPRMAPDPRRTTLGSEVPPQQANRPRVRSSSLHSSVDWQPYRPESNYIR